MNTINEKIVEGEVIRIPEADREAVRSVSRGGRQAAARLGYGGPADRAAPGKGDLLAMYGAFKDTPIPDKGELRRCFHEKSAD